MVILKMRREGYTLMGFTLLLLLLQHWRLTTRARGWSSLTSSATTSSPMLELRFWTCKISLKLHCLETLSQIGLTKSMLQAVFECRFVFDMLVKWRTKWSFQCRKVISGYQKVWSAKHLVFYYFCQAQMRVRT